MTQAKQPLESAADSVIPLFMAHNKVGRTRTEAYAAALRELQFRQVVLAIALAGAMLLVSMFLAAVGLLALKLSGGISHDTALVILVTACGVTDMWGGALIASLTGSNIRRTTILWTVARLIWLTVVSIVLTLPFAVLAIQLGVAIAGSRIGAQLGRYHAAVRRQEAQMPPPRARHSSLRRPSRT